MLEDPGALVTGPNALLASLSITEQSTQLTDAAAVCYVPTLRLVEVPGPPSAQIPPTVQEWSEWEGRKREDLNLPKGLR